MYHSGLYLRQINFYEEDIFCVCGYSRIIIINCACTHIMRNVNVCRNGRGSQRELTLGKLIFVN